MDFAMSSESSLQTTAASDTSSSADSRYFSSRVRRGSFNVNIARGATSKPGEWSQSSRRRRSYNLKARGVVIAKAAAQSGGNQKVFCVCKGCKGQRLVSKSTCYRHLRVEAEVAEDDIRRCAGWSRYMNASHMQALRLYGIMRLAGIRFGL